MAEIWLATDRNTGQPVVLKIVPADANPELRRWLCREGGLGQRLHHPGIVPVLGVFDGNDRPFIAMEYLPGGDIGRLAGAPLPEILPIVIQVAEALCYAHGQGVIHRDLKAGNVLLDGNGRARVADFGIADHDSASAGGPPITGGGSRAFVSPQQLAGLPASPTDDLYSFGALVHAMVTGEPPLGTAPTDEAIRDQTPPPMTGSWSVPHELQSLVDRLLAKDPSQRPKGMTEVLSELRAIEQSFQEHTLPPRSDPTTDDVRLTPPPRPPAIRADTGPRLGSHGSPGGPLPLQLRTWGTAAVFVALGVLAVFVFVVLPTWVERRPADSLSTLAPATAAPSTHDETDAEMPSADQPPSRTAEVPPEAPAPPTPSVEPGLAATVAARPDGKGAAPRQDSDDRFAAAMSEGLAALEAGHPVVAREAFERARALQPTSPGVAEGIRRAERQQRRQRISTLRGEAAAAEAREDWQSAEKAYAAVLAIDENIAFAQEGVERSARRRQLADDMTRHLARPERLVDEQVLADAEAALERARETEPKGPRLEDLISRLADLVEVASTPVSVSLHSDNLTQVIIYRVGRLGTFARTTVQLRPGTYTLVGSRSGFQDVRVELTVRPGGPMPPVIIRCEDEV